MLSMVNFHNKIQSGNVNKFLIEFEDRSRISTKIPIDLFKLRAQKKIEVSQGMQNRYSYRVSAQVKW